MIKKTKKNTYKHRHKKGGSTLKLSPQFIQSIVNRLQHKTKKNISSNSISRRVKLMKGNYNKKIRNITKKHNSNSYSNAEIINTSGPEWNIKVGNNRKEKVPPILLPKKRAKGAVFIRITSNKPF